MNVKKQSIRERLLLSELMLYRYEEEIRIIQDEILAQQAKQTEEKKGLRQFFEGVAAKVMKAKEDPEKALEQAKKNLEDYTATIDPETDIALSEDPDRLTIACNELFDRDNGTRRMTLGLEFVLMEAAKGIPTFLRPDQSRKAASKILFNDEDLLGKILEVYVYSARYIAGLPQPAKSSEVRDTGLVLSAIGGAITLFGGFTGVGAVVGPLMSIAGLALFGYGHRKQKMEQEATNDLMLFSTFIATHDVRKKRFGRRAAKKLRQAGREATAKDYVHSLATGITIFNFRFEEKETDLAKNALSLYLEMLDSLRADAEYLAYVERVDIEENHKKILAANRAIELLHALITKDVEKQGKDIEIIEVSPVIA